MVTERGRPGGDKHTEPPILPEEPVPGYFVLLVDISDRDAYADYARAVPPTYAAYGERMAGRGPVAGVVEGVAEVREDTMLAVLEFETLDQARSWWSSQECQRVLNLRKPPVSQSRAFSPTGLACAGDASRGDRQHRERGHRHGQPPAGRSLPEPRPESPPPRRRTRTPARAAPACTSSARARRPGPGQDDRAAGPGRS